MVAVKKEADGLILGMYEDLTGRLMQDPEKSLGSHLCKKVKVKSLSRV